MLPVSPPAYNPPAATVGSPSSCTEPLFSLLTTSHPFLATTIEGASSAYGGAKNFSPRFKSGAEYVEGYLTPIGNTLGSVGRVTGVEGGVRWFLGAGRRQGTSSSDQEVVGNSKKRRKMDSPADAMSSKRFEAATSPLTASEAVTMVESLPSTPRGDRRSSLASTVETLPAYDEVRSPAYTESADSQTQQQPGGLGSPWQSRLIMSTSGLSVAMSKESLRSLKFCLHWLKWANQHMAHVIEALKNTLEQYERAGDGGMEESRYAGTHGQVLPVAVEHITEGEPQQSRGELAARISSLKGDVVKTLQGVINTVSTYAGGALPENAKLLVRRHLTSLPQRFRVASMAQPAEGSGTETDESSMRDGAQKVLVLAKEGLDMVVQISGVVDGTILSAEEWLDRIGRKEPEKDPELVPVQPREASQDVKMGSE